MVASSVEKKGGKISILASSVENKGRKLGIENECCVSLFNGERVVEEGSFQG